jgi:hypothetical protein
MFALKSHHYKFQPKIRTGTCVGTLKNVSERVRKKVFFSEQNSCSFLMLYFVFTVNYQFITNRIKFIAETKTDCLVE